MAAADTQTWLARALVAMAEVSSTDGDTEGICSAVVSPVRELTEAVGVGVWVRDHDGLASMAASSSGAIEALGELEMVKGAGPALAACGSGSPVANLAPEEAERRWPQLVPLWRAAGIDSAHALALRARGACVGALVVYRAQQEPMGAQQLEVLQALADAAGVALVRARELAEARGRADQLQEALDSRVLIEQAKGVLAERLAVPVDQAFALLRRQARSSNRRLVSVAQAVVSGAGVHALTAPPRRQVGVQSSGRRAATLSA